MDRKQKFLEILLFFVLIILLSSCKKEKTGLFNQELKVIPVKAFKVKKLQNIPITLEYPGMTRSYRSVLVKAKISGEIKKIFFQEGEIVKKGSSLVEIDRALYKARYDSALAGLSQAKALLYQANSTWQRIKRAYQAGLVSKEQRDQALSAYKRAIAGLKLAKAQVKEAQIYLNYTLPKAPFTGKTGKKLVHLGTLVAPGVPLVKIEQNNPIYVEFSIPDQDVYKYALLEKGKNFLKKLKPVLCFDNKCFNNTGRITFISPSLDQKTASLLVKALFKNPDYQILPNLFVRVKLLGVKLKGGLVVPQRAVIHSPEGYKVFVIKNGIAISKTIQVLHTYKNYYIVKGLNPGDVIATTNLFRLVSGKKVEIIKFVQE